MKRKNFNEKIGHTLSDMRIIKAGKFLLGNSRAKRVIKNRKTQYLKEIIGMTSESRHLKMCIKHTISNYFFYNRAAAVFLCCQLSKCEKDEVYTILSMLYSRKQSESSKDKFRTH